MPDANLCCFQKSTFYAGINIFSSLPPSVTILKHDNAKFKKALRKHLHSFYCVYEFFMCKNYFCKMFVVFYCKFVYLVYL